MKRTIGEDELSLILQSSNFQQQFIRLSKLMLNQLDDLPENEELQKLMTEDFDEVDSDNLI